MNVVIMGSAHAGTSALATRLARESSVALLALDSLADAAELGELLARHRDWVSHGSHAELLETALREASRLLFLSHGYGSDEAELASRHRALFESFRGDKIEITE